MDKFLGRTFDSNTRTYKFSDDSDVAIPEEVAYLVREEIDKSSGWMTGQFNHVFGFIERKKNELRAIRNPHKQTP